MGTGRVRWADPRGPSPKMKPSPSYTTCPSSLHQISAEGEPAAHRARASRVARVASAARPPTRMARQFDIPAFYRSPVIGRVKAARRAADPRKKDLAPSVLDFGPLRVRLARHFGFCFGVENAVEIAYRAIEERPEAAAAGRLFLLSEMIHNPHVNEDLQARGVRFLRTTAGEELVPLRTLRPDDVVIIPAFGAPTEVMEALAARGIDPELYDTTCPFVVRVWKKSAQIGAKAHTIVVHGKPTHEETRATVSRARASAPTVTVKNLDEAERLAAVVERRQGAAFFWEHFAGRTSEGFDPERDLERLGVVNQTTMLATETAAIAERLRAAVEARDGDDANAADTSDTLCYATKENQDATLALIESARAPLAEGRALAVVVGGRNSSNTSHLVELCEDAGLPTYFVTGAEALGAETVEHFDWRAGAVRHTRDWLPDPAALDGPIDLTLTAGASCPDAQLDAALHRILELVPGTRPLDAVLAEAVAPFEAEAA